MMESSHSPLGLATMTAAATATALVAGYFVFRDSGSTKNTTSPVATTTANLRCHNLKSAPHKSSSRLQEASPTSLQPPSECSSEDINDIVECPSWNIHRGTIGSQHNSPSGNVYYQHSSLPDPNHVGSCEGGGGSQPTSPLAGGPSSSSTPPPPLLCVPTLQGATVGSMVRVEGKSYVNCSSFNFLGLAHHPEIRHVAHKAVDGYGVGTCGPRGFYGTLRPHLELEEALQEYLGVERCIMYSFGFCTIASILPVFAGRGDVLVVDSGVSQGIQSGVTLARHSEVVWFRHNSVEDLRRVLMELQSKTAAAAAQATASKSTSTSSAKTSRRFVVIEGLYRNYGDLAPLPEIVALCQEFKYRLVVDDSVGFGVLGACGRGTPEHFGVPLGPGTIDLYVGSLCHAVGSVGGFSVGAADVVEHQRLASAAYCFSASTPTFLVVAALKALEILRRKTSPLAPLPDVVARCQANAALVRELLTTSPPYYAHAFEISQQPPSPLFHLRFPEGEFHSYRQEALALQRVSDAVRERASAILCACAYNTSEERWRPRPSLRLCVSAEHTAEQLTRVVNTLTVAMSEVRHQTTTTTAAAAVDTTSTSSEADIA